MNIIDIAILLMLLLGAIIGFKKGFTTALVSALSFFATVVIAFLLKNTVSIFLYANLPFFKFGGILKGVTVLNIALYEILAFIILMIVISIVFKIILSITKLFERVLKMTIILGFPSQILGAVVGLVDAYIWVFIIMYVLSLPIVSFDLIEQSKYKDKILNETIILSNYTEDTTSVVNEFIALREKYEDTPNATEFNRETLDLFLKYNIITVENVDKLIEKDKLKIDNVETILSKYREV